MSNHKTANSKSDQNQFSPSHAQLIERTALRWLEEVEHEFNLASAAELTDEERKKLEEATSSIAEALGVGEPFKVIQDIKRDQRSRIRAILDESRGRKGGN